MRPDPPRSRNNKCAQPGCNKPLTRITNQHRKYFSAVSVSLDPFCSSTCAREWHGTQLTGTKGTE